MKAKADKIALELHKKGLNCAQAVLTSCGEYTGLDDDTAYAIASGFGRGMCSGEMCGAISGAVMAIGISLSGSDPEDKEAKKKINVLTRKCVNSAKKKYGCVRCAELKANGVGCDEMIRKMSKTAEKIIKDNMENGEKENGDL